MSNSPELPTVTIPGKLLTDRRLSNTDKLALVFIPYLEQLRHGVYKVRARDLAYFLQSGLNTASRCIVRLSQCDYLKIEEQKKGKDGGFIVSLRRAAFSVFLSLGAAGSLHNGNYVQDSEFDGIEAFDKIQNIHYSAPGNWNKKASHARRRQAGDAPESGHSKASPVPGMSQNEYDFQQLFGQL